MDYNTILVVFNSRLVFVNSEHLQVTGQSPVLQIHFAFTAIDAAEIDPVTLKKLLLAAL
jgi:hypothetical protein